MLAVAAALELEAPPVAATEPNAAYLFAIGQSLRLEGSYTEALEKLEAAARADPNEPFLQLELAEFLLQLGRLEDALPHAERARDLAPESLPVLEMYGRVQLRRADRESAALESARSAFEQIRRLDEKNIEARVTLGRMYLNMSRPGEAINPLREARTLRPGDRIVTSLLVEALGAGGDGVENESVLREIVLGDPGFLSARVALAQMLNRRGAVEEAVRLLEGVPESDRDNSSYLRELALGHYRLGSWDKALGVARRWLDWRPDDVTARYLLGLTLAALERDAEAEEVLGRLVEEQPANPDFVRALADVVERQGRPDEAAAMLEKAVRERRPSGSDEASRAVLAQLLDLYARSAEWDRLLAVLDGLLSEDGPVDESEVRLVRAQALMELDRRDQALAEVRTVLAVGDRSDRLIARASATLFELARPEEAERALSGLAASEDPQRLMLAAEVLHRYERFARAAEVLRRADRLRPDDSEILFWLGASLERAGSFGEAEVELRRVLELEPDFAPALNYLGYMLADRGEKLDEALELVRRAVAQEPDNGAYLDSLGWALFRLGRLEDAKVYLERAVELETDDAVVLEHLGDLYRAQGKAALAAARYEEALALGGENQDSVRRKLQELRVE